MPSRYSGPSLDLTAGSSTSIKRQFCELPPFGALIAASRIVACTRSGIGSGLTRRIALVVYRAPSRGSGRPSARSCTGRRIPTLRSGHGRPPPLVGSPWAGNRRLGSPGQTSRPTPAILGNGVDHHPGRRRHHHDDQPPRPHPAQPQPTRHRRLTRRAGRLFRARNALTRNVPVRSLLTTHAAAAAARAAPDQVLQLSDSLSWKFDARYA